MTLRLVDGRPLATTTGALRTLARVVLDQGECRGLLAFGAADNHLHAELVTDRATAGAFAHYVETSLRWRLALASELSSPPVAGLADAACAAFALADLGVRCNEVRAAQRAAIHAAGPRASTRALSHELSLPARTVQRLRAQPVDALAMSAVLLQARIRAPAEDV